jgi:hypothetical protein
VGGKKRKERGEEEAYRGKTNGADIDMSYQGQYNLSE